MHAENIRIAMKKIVTQQEALRQLAAMCATAEHCRHDMLQKMQAWGLSEEAQEHIIHQLVEGRYVDDERYCRAFVADKMKYNKWGRRKIDMALCQKRIEADIRHRVLGAVASARASRPTTRVNATQNSCDSPSNGDSPSTR